jgi:NADH:ubiquinone oxidoreductase subunit D
VLPELGKGLLIADVVAIMASLDIIMPEVDR